MTTTLPKEKLGYSVPEIMAALGINNRNKVYQFFHTGELGSYTIGTRRFASREALVRFIKRREAATKGKPIVARGRAGNGRSKEARAS